MQEKTSNGTNVLLSWGLAALIGALAFVLLLLFGTSFFGSVFLGGVIFVVLGALFAWLFLSPLPPIGHVAQDAQPSAGQGSAASSPAPSSPAPSAPAPAAAPAPTAAPAAAPAAAASGADEPLVKPSAPLAGQEDLASRKGTWRYDGGDAPASAAPAAAAAGEDYDGDGVVEGTDEGTKPQLLDGPREGGADDLKQIKGIGPKLEGLCNKLGVYHFDQVANWTADEVAWVDANLEGFKGRVSRDEWVSQAKILSEGGETAFSKKVEGGGVYD